MSPRPNPEMSVVIGVLNGELTLEQQLAAVLGQDTNFEFEVIVVDHGSSDCSAQILSQLALSDSRVRLVNGAHLKPGGAAPKNLGVQLAESGKIAFCDADDVVQPGWLQALFDGLTRSLIVFARLEYWSLNPRHVRRNRAQFANDRGGGAFGIWKSTYIDLGLFDEDFEGAVDAEFFLRAQELRISSETIEDAIVSVRLPHKCKEIFSRQRRLSFSHPVLEARSIRGKNSRQMLLAALVGVLRASLGLSTKAGRYRFCGSLGALLGRLEGTRALRSQIMQPY